MEGESEGGSEGGEGSGAGVLEIMQAPSVKRAW